MLPSSARIVFLVSTLLPLSSTLQLQEQVRGEKQENFSFSSICFPNVAAVE